MTYNQLIAKMASLLEDEGKLFYSDTEIADSLQDGFWDIAVETRCIERVIQVTFPTSPYLTITTPVPDYHAPTAIYNKNNNRWLPAVDFKTLEGLNDQWDTETGTPEFFCPIDFNTIAIYPTYQSVPTENMVLFYISVGDGIVNSEEINLFPRDSEILLNYSVSDLLDTALEYRKSGMYFGEYLQFLSKVKLDMKRRNQADRFLQMVAQYADLV